MAAAPIDLPIGKLVDHGRFSPCREEVAKRPVAQVYSWLGPRPAAALFEGSSEVRAPDEPVGVSASFVTEAAERADAAEASEEVDSGNVSCSREQADTSFDTTS
jgi:hypothetical protein